ncbi:MULTISPECIES: DUF2130 domain-containing protein [Bradyrhizobium]
MDVGSFRMLQELVNGDELTTYGAMACCGQKPHRHGCDDEQRDLCNGALLPRVLQHAILESWVAGVPTMRATDLAKLRQASHGSRKVGVEAFRQRILKFEKICHSTHGDVGRLAALPGLSPDPKAFAAARTAAPSRASRPFSVSWSLAYGSYRAGRRLRSLSGADIAVIVSQARPRNVEHFDMVDGIWVTHPRCAIPSSEARLVGHDQR